VRVRHEAEDDQGEDDGRNGGIECERVLTQPALRPGEALSDGEGGHERQR
jgi:hypothetical protein